MFVFVIINRNLDEVLTNKTKNYEFTNHLKINKITQESQD